IYSRVAVVRHLWLSFGATNDALSGRTARGTDQLSRALVDACCHQWCAIMGNPAAGSQARRSDSLQTPRVGFAVQLRCHAIYLSGQALRQSGRVLANDEISRKRG